jgi:hypothetical protein
MQTEKHPYELLIRWNQQGEIAGAHVAYRYVIKDDAGAVMTEVPGQAEPLALDGFPLAELLTQAQAGALAATEALRTELAAATAQRDAALAQLAEQQPAA